MSTSPQNPTSGEVTGLLVAMREGDKGALGRLMPLVYDELRAMARGQLRRHGQGQKTLATTALVNEAYVKLVGHGEAAWKDRCHFMAVATLAMRQILVDAARKRRAEKRGGGQAAVTLDDALGTHSRAEDILAVHEALEQLEELDARLGRIVELRFFGGLSVEETAEVMDCSARTVKRDWRKARAFLLRQLSLPLSSA